MTNDPSNDIILGGIDQFLPTKSAQKEILNKVDDVMEKAVRENDPEIAGEYMRALLGVSQISGLSFAKFLYTMKFQWSNFNRRDSFHDWAIDGFGKVKKTVNDNIRVWEFLVSGDVPKEYCDKFKNMPIRCLIPIANLWAQKYEVESHQWAKLSNAPDPSTVNKIIREIKGVEPKKDSLQMEYHSEEKELVMWKNGKPHYVYLQFDENDEVVLAGLERLFGDGRTLEK